MNRYRPSMASAYTDTAYPMDVDDHGRICQSKSFHQVKYELSRLSEAVLELVLKIEEPSYDQIRSLQSRLTAFEIDIPFNLRCRTGLLSLPSIYPDTTRATADSPDIDKRNLTLTLQVSVDPHSKCRRQEIHAGQRAEYKSNLLWLSQSQRRWFSSTDHSTQELFKSRSKILLNQSTAHHTSLLLNDLMYVYNVPTTI